MPSTSACVLGEPCVAVDGELHPIGSQKQRALLAMLAIGGRSGVRVERVVEELWGGAPPVTSRKNVQVLIGHLRSLLGSHDAIVHEGGVYRLGDAVGLDSRDAARLLGEARAAAAAGDLRDAVDRSARALALWRGDAFGDLRDETWAMISSRELDDLRLELRELWLSCRLELGEHAECAALLDEFVARNPGRARLHELRIVALSTGGLQARALEACRDALRALPTASTGTVRELQRDLLRRCDASSPSEPLVGTMHASDEETVGRDEELAELERLLLRGERFVTIVGPGGCGKTHLARELVRRVADGFEDSVWVDLAQVVSSDAIVPLVIRTLDVTGGDADPIDAIESVLRRKRTLVVLDNFEHVVDGSGLVAMLYERSPTSTFLVTSRIELSVAVERTMSLEPFTATPDGPAVDLFMKRAARVDGLVDDATPKELIADICRLVDGLPLGIELAAARTRLLGPEQLRDRLTSRFDLLRSSDQTVPERHRSLYHVIDWSIDSLESRDVPMLDTLAVCPGGATIDRAARISGLSVGDARPALDRLRQWSLATMEVDVLGDLRFRLPDTVRQVVLERLAASGAADACRMRMVADMATCAARVAMHRPGIVADDRIVDAEYENLAAAIEWAASADPDSAHRMYGNLRRFHSTRGRFIDAHRLSEVVARSGSLTRADVDARGLFQFACAEVLHFRGESEQAVRMLAEARPDLEACSDARLVAESLATRADALRSLARFDEASADAAEAVAMAGPTGDHATLGRCLVALANVHGDIDEIEESIDLLLRAIELLEGVDEHHWKLAAESQIATYRTFVGQGGECGEEFDRIAREAESVGMQSIVATARGLEIRSLIEQQRYVEAFERAERHLGDIEGSGERLLHCFVLSVLAGAAALADDAARSTRYAIPALQIALDSNGYMFADYAVVALAVACRQAGDAAGELSALECVDGEHLSDQYALDVRVQQLIAKRRDSLASQVRCVGGADALDRVAAGSRASRLRALIVRCGQLPT